MQTAMMAAAHSTTHAAVIRVRLKLAHTHRRAAHERPANQHDPITRLVRPKIDDNRRAFSGT